MAAAISTRPSPPTSSHDHLPLSTDRSRQVSAGGSSASSTPPTSMMARKPKVGGGKAPDAINTSKQIEDTIAQLERNKAGDKEQDIEIEREVKKANRELSNLLNSLDGPMQKIDLVQRKYTDLLYEMKRVEREHIKTKKRADQLQKDKDANRSELNKTMAFKDKLEKLCRELQKDNKVLKLDKDRILDNETTMREQLHSRLESMTDEVQHVINQKETPEDLPVDFDSDELFRQKFKSFIDQYELREIQFNSILKAKEIEVQYQTARYDQLRKTQEQEANKSRQLSSQVSTFSQTETELRSQLNIYVEKFKQVEDTLNNSNDLFLTFRKEMEEMSKKTKRLEKENHNLTRKHELTNHNILQMAEERTKTSKEMELLRKKNDNLEKLCRGMQAQGRGQQVPMDESAESDYEDEEDDEDEEDEDEDQDEDEEIVVRPIFGPPAPPPSNGAVNGASSYTLLTD